MSTNLIPSFSSGAWNEWTPYENKRPIFENTGDSLKITSTKYSDCGKWICEFPVTPGENYEISFDVKTERVEYAASCVRVMAIFFAEGKKDAVLFEYAVDKTDLGDGWVRYSKYMTAPKAGVAPYSDDATKVVIELLMWNSDDGEVTYKNPSFVAVEPKKHRLVKVCTTYINPYTPDSRTYEDRVKKILRTADEAGAQNPDIIMFSEFIATRELNLPREVAAQTIPGPLTDLLAEKARKYNTYIAFNMCEVEDGYYYNTTALIDRRGNIAGRYRKVHLTYRECTSGMTPGRDYPVFETDFGKIGTVTCFDHFFPESVRQTVINGAELIFVSTAGDGYMQSTARAQDNYVPMIISCVNHAKMSVWPQSRIVAPDGTILAGTMSDCGAACATIDLDEPYKAFWFSVGPSYSEKHDIFLAEARPDTYIK